MKQLSYAICECLKGNYQFFTNKDYRKILNQAQLTVDDLIQYCDFLMNAYSNSIEFANAIESGKTEYFSTYSGATR